LSFIYKYDDLIFYAVFWHAMCVHVYMLDKWQ